MIGGLIVTGQGSQRVIVRAIGPSLPVAGKLADPTLEFTIDVERRILEAPSIGLTVDFPLDDSVRHRFLEGLDDIDLTLQHEDAITAYEGNAGSASR